MTAGSNADLFATTYTSGTGFAPEDAALNTKETATSAMTMPKKVIRRMRHPTTMRPVIFGWIEQKYLYAPGVWNRWENCSSVSSTGDLNFCSVLTTLWGTSSRFVHVIIVPTGTDAFAGA